MKNDSTLNLYTVFHLNMAYSAIEEEQRPEVIEKCYWPLLNLAEKQNLPFGIEATAYTLETIEKLAPDWIKLFKHLINKGSLEFVGSGYAQLIGPLVPGEVNAANLRIGNDLYQHYLGIRPVTALVNEQAYSSGLVEHYLNAGYRALIMEWDNAVFSHEDWEPLWRYYPQYACGPVGEKIALIWNKSIAFQKFQRYAHGDIELDQYLQYLTTHIGRDKRAFPLYGSDIEVFDFRPGRFATEALLHEDGEWNRIQLLFETLSMDRRFSFISPSGVLSMLNEPFGGNPLNLESSEQPVPVKKQGKYNLTRWAVTGRDDLAINTACWQAYDKLAKNSRVSEEEWKELCYLWSSDYRTHITQKRWLTYLKRLNKFHEKLKIKQGEPGPEDGPGVNASNKRVSAKPIEIENEGRYLTVHNDQLSLKLNCRRGLAVEGLWAGEIKGQPLIGTLGHGYYNDIRYAADWYSGHLVLERLGQPKVTDLEPAEIEINEEETGVIIRAVIASPLGDIHKKLNIEPYKGKLTISYNLDWKEIPPGSFRLGFLTINPESFERSSLFYRTCNGGFKPEHFSMEGSRIDQGSAVSFLVSASSGLGLTEGWIDIGDENRFVRVAVDKTTAALIGLVTYHEIDDTYFFRLALSAGEMDETRKFAKSQIDENKYQFSIVLK